MRKFLGVVLIAISGLILLIVVLSIISLFFDTGEDSVGVRKMMLDPYTLFGYLIFITVLIVLLRTGIRIYRVAKIDNAGDSELPQNESSFEIIIHSKIELSDYIKLYFLLAYKKRPFLLLINASGLAILFYSISYYLGYGTYTGTYPPFVTLILGIFFSSMPFLFYIQAKKNFRSNARLHEGIDYKFTYDKIYIKGESFNSEMTWKGTYKVEELSNWFLIYQNNVVFNPISKKDIPPEQLSEFRDLVKSISGIKTNIK